ncbi:MAG: hypothetical protein NVSMB18_19280 [Acetobacteraceae bacterium]
MVDGTGSGIDMGGFGGGADMGGFGGGGVVIVGGTVQVPMGVITPPALPSAHFPLLHGVTFPRRAWDPSLYAQAVLAEFAASGWMEVVTIEPPPVSDAEIAGEIDFLLNQAQKRASRAPEILAQAQDASNYWRDMLMINAASRPATWDLITAAATVGHMVAMHFKLKFRRPRPVQFYPALMPPILTPPHPSYPNAHALEAALITACVELVVPAMREPLDQLAKRVAENHEIAGLHFRTDTNASFALAPQLRDQLLRGPLFGEILAQARAEWTDVTAIPFPAR